MCYRGRSFRTHAQPRTRAHSDSRITYVQAFAEEAEFPKASADVVVSVLALHYVADLLPVLQRDRSLARIRRHVRRDPGAPDLHLASRAVRLEHGERPARRMAG